MGFALADYSEMGMAVFNIGESMPQVSLGNQSTGGQEA